MKVIATTQDRFLVEMTADEIAQAAGFSSTYDSGWEKVNGQRQPKVGVVVHVNVAIGWHSRINQHQEQAKSAANTLRALADLIGGALPEVVVPAYDPNLDEVKS